jgi:hypothetical protein
VFAYGHMLCAGWQGHHELAWFSSHWAACAAMIRLRQPDFVSLGGDKPEDLAEEARLRRDHPELACPTTS